MASEKSPQKTPFWKSQYRPDRPARPARSVPSDVPVRSDRAERPDRSERPLPAGRPSRPVRPSRAFGSDAPFRPSQPERPFRPERPERPAFRPERPARPGLRPDRAGRSFRPGPPAFSAAPASPGAPADSQDAPSASTPPVRRPFKPRPKPEFMRESGSGRSSEGSRPSYQRTFAPKPKFEFHPGEEDVSDALPTVYLNPGEADRVVMGHPWVYDGSVLRLTREPADGDVVQVKDHRRRLLGVGFYNAKSRIRIRVLHHERVEIDEAFFENRIRAALEHRKRFLPDATSYRVVNAEGDRLSGLIVDKYEDVLVLQTSSVGMDRRKNTIVRVLEKLLQPRAVLERNDMGARKFEGLPDANGILSGNLSEEEQAALPIQLNGLRFEVNLRSGHKTGVYLDQQVNHALVASLARGARVLDAFTFLGGFALNAARAGAHSVVGIDQSEESITTARRLAQANRLDNICSFEAGNAFDWLRTRAAVGALGTANPGVAPEPAFDLVVLDPPSFTRNRASIPDALRGYKEIHLRALKLLRPGGILASFCCSHHVDAKIFEAAILEASFDAHRQLRRIATYTQSPDHPILPAIPETEYLKGYAYEVLGG